MKRSEAVKNIINVLRLTGNHYCDDGRDEQDAERILKRIETIGMLPPTVKGGSMNGWNRWESEDEEK